MARLHQFNKLNETIEKDKTYIIIDNEKWQNEKIIDFNYLIDLISKENSSNIEFYKYPNDEKVPPEQCELVEPLKISIDYINSDIYFWINNSWKKCQLLDR